MRFIDIETWERRDIFRLFSQLDYPFYAVTVPLDVTGVKDYAKSHGLSFYYTMIWLSMRAVNQVEAFRMRIRGEQVVVLDLSHPSFTVMKPGKTAFQIVTLPAGDDLPDFCRRAAEKVAQQVDFIAHDDETDELTYISCTPWFDFTALTNERSFDRDDTVPRLAWGKYYEENGRLKLHLSIDVNHRTIDGYHIGQFVSALEKAIQNLSACG